MTNVAGSYGVAGGAHSIGSAWGDFDNDGYMDLLAGNFSHSGQEPPLFHRNLGPAGSYNFSTEWSLNSGDGNWVESYASVATADYDNDGDLDVFITAVYEGQNSRLYSNNGAGGWTWSNVTSAEGLSGLGGAGGSSYAAAWADVDNDGDLDLATEGKLFINNSQSNGNHWLKINLTGNGTTINSAAIGAQVRVDTGSAIITRQIEGGTGEGNQNDLTMHFGLGSHSGTVDVEILWPDGTIETISDVPVDQLFQPGMGSGIKFNQEVLGGALTGYTSNTLDASTGGNGWLYGALRVQLGEGEIYQDPLGTNNPPDASLIGANPTLQYDSYLTGGTDSVAPSTTGPAANVFGGAVDLGGGIPMKFGTTQIDATWASTLATNPSGELMLARVTLSNDAQGTYSALVGVANNDPVSMVGGLIADGAMQEIILTTTFTQEDPGATLEGYVSNLWEVDTLGGEWLSAVLLFDLTSGDIYQDLLGTNNPPDASLIGANPSLEFDTYMTGGTDTLAPSTTGPSPSVFGGAVDLGGAIPLEFDVDGINATWATSLATNPSGNLMLGRFTLSDDAQGTFKFRLGVGEGGAVFYYGGVIVDGAMLFLPLIPGDADGDRDVDAADAAILASFWQQSVTGGASEGDFNGDGYTNDLDATILATNWQVGVAATAAVPEPGMMALLACGLTMLLGARRRGPHPNKFTA